MFMNIKMFIKSTIIFVLGLLLGIVIKGNMVKPVHLSLSPQVATLSITQVKINAIQSPISFEVTLACQPTEDFVKLVNNKAADSKYTLPIKAQAYYNDELHFLNTPNEIKLDLSNNNEVQIICQLEEEIGLDTLLETLNSLDISFIDGAYTYGANYYFTNPKDCVIK